MRLTSGQRGTKSMSIEVIRVVVPRSIRGETRVELCRKVFLSQYSNTVCARVPFSISALFFSEITMTFVDINMQAGHVTLMRSDPRAALKSNRNVVIKELCSDVTTTHPHKH